MVKNAYDAFRQCGYISESIEKEFAEREAKGFSLDKLSENRYEGEKATFYVPKSDGVLACVDNGKADIGIVGEDAKLEYEVGTKRGGGFRSFEIGPKFDFPKMRFALVGKPMQELKFMECLRNNKFIEIATSYPAIAKEFMARNYPQFSQIFLDIIDSSGETELLAGDLGLVNAAFELVGTGKSLQKNGLIQFGDKEQNIPVLGVVNNGSERNNEQLAALASKLGEKGVVDGDGMLRRKSFYYPKSKR